MKNLNLILIFVFTLLLYSCEKEHENKSHLNFEKVSGTVQKGPYLNGTAITISELTNDLSPTGKNFTSEIFDNKGTFEIENVDLSSQYVKLKADGFYFNEVTNTNSSAQLTLFALSDLSNKSSLNANILSTLEKNRVDYLVSNGNTFAVAKKQAQSEILSIFEISSNEIFESEQLDITKPGDDNAILLAVSLIVQGYLPVSDVSELIANISTEISEDGKLNNQSIGSILISNAKTLELETIRINLESRYEALGMNSTAVPDFEKYVSQFIERTDFIPDSIRYPEFGTMGENLLFKNKNYYSKGFSTNYVLYAVLPPGSKLKIECVNWSGFPISASAEATGWKRYRDKKTDNHVLETIRTGEVEIEAFFVQHNNNQDCFIKYYENNDTLPTFVKELNPNRNSLKE